MTEPTPEPIDWTAVVAGFAEACRQFCAEVLEVLEPLRPLLALVEQAKANPGDPIPLMIDGRQVGQVTSFDGQTIVCSVPHHLDLGELGPVSIARELPEFDPNWLCISLPGAPNVAHLLEPGVTHVTACGERIPFDRMMVQTLRARWALQSDPQYRQPPATACTACRETLTL
jgi:hypothetical protein